MMIRQSDDEQKVERNSRIIYDEVGRLENILDGLLAFSHPRQPQFEWRNLCEIINNSIQMVDEEYAARKIEVEVECPDDLHRVYVDGEQIHQVFDNLERNAIEAMEEGGTLSIRIHEEDTAVVCEVSDTGDGIPHSHLDQIFDTFFTTKPTGMGLGLALTRKIVQDHGVELDVRSEKDVGTTFILEFPTDCESLEEAGLLEPDGESQQEGE
ncbi:MAG: ATP-binding protein [Armatimonadota bacterium]